MWNSVCPLLAANQLPGLLRNVGLNDDARSEEERRYYVSLIQEHYFADIASINQRVSRVIDRSLAQRAKRGACAYEDTPTSPFVSFDVPRGG